MILIEKIHELKERNAEFLHYYNNEVESQVLGNRPLQLETYFDDDEDKK